MAEELLRIAEVAAEVGIGKIRLTGGEPLTHRGIPEFSAPSVFQGAAGYPQNGKARRVDMRRQLAEALKGLQLERKKEVAHRPPKNFHKLCLVPQMVHRHQIMRK